MNRGIASPPNPRLTVGINMIRVRRVHDRVHSVAELDQGPFSITSLCENPRPRNRVLNIFVPLLPGRGGIVIF